MLGLTGVCMESSSPEPTSGSHSGTGRAFYGRLQQDFLDEENDPYDFNSLMQNHLRVIQEQAESQADSRQESRVDQSENDPCSPISGVKGGSMACGRVGNIVPDRAVQTNSDRELNSNIS